jgi:hypothetical protein
MTGVLVGYRIEGTTRSIREVHPALAHRAAQGDFLRGAPKGGRPSGRLRGTIACVCCRSTVNPGAMMNLTFGFGPVASLIAGILILLVPRLLNYIVALYLIIIGLIGIFGLGK